MRPIKFRGRDLDSGEYVFFNLEDILLDVAGSYSEYVGLHNIDPDSVTQLVGYDKNGKEVYEDDTVIAEDGHEWLVLFNCSVLSDEGFNHNIPLEFFTLKEDNQ